MGQSAMEKLVHGLHEDRGIRYRRLLEGIHLNCVAHTWMDIGLGNEVCTCLMYLIRIEEPRSITTRPRKHAEYLERESSGYSKHHYTTNVSTVESVKVHNKRLHQVIDRSGRNVQ